MLTRNRNSCCVSKGTRTPKMVSLATVESAELQFIIDQTLGPRIFCIYQASMGHVECAKWLPLPASWVLWDRTSEAQLCSAHWKDFFLLLYNSFRTALNFLIDRCPGQQSCLLWIVLCSSYMLSSNCSKALDSLYKLSSGKHWKMLPSAFSTNITFL